MVVEIDNEFDYGRRDEERKVIGIVSGKGGVGKTVATINLGYALHGLGKKVILVDADTTASNLGLQLGIYRYPTKFQDVLNGRVRIEDAIIEHPSGLKIVPSSISVKDIKTNADAYINVFDSLEGIVLVDSPPSLTKHSLSVLDACSEFIVVSNPDLPSLTNALKVQQISQKRNKEVLGMLLNRVANKYYELNADEKMISINVLLGPGDYTSKIIVSYENGYSETDLEITSSALSPLMGFIQDKGLLALVLAVNILFILFIFRHYSHSFLRIEHEIKEEEETIRRRLSAYAAHIEHNKERKPSIPHQLMKLIYAFHVVEPRNYWDNNNGENWDVATTSHSYIITYENPLAKKVYIHWTKDNWKTTYDVLMVKHKDKFEAKLRI